MNAEQINNQQILYLLIEKRQQRLTLKQKHEISEIRKRWVKGDITTLEPVSLFT